MKSPFQYTHQPDGTIGLAGLPNVQLAMVEDQGKVTGRDWQTELGLPAYAEEWEALATVRGLSERFVRFIVMDQSESRLPGHPRFNPQALILPEQGVPFELGHTGLLIGHVYAFVFGFGEARAEIAAQFNIDPEGEFIVGQARLFDSALAEAARRGLQQQIFTHVCPMTFSAVGETTLVQVTLTPGDYVGCPNAKILATWDEL